MKENTRVILEKRVRKLEEALNAIEDLSLKDRALHDELVDDLNAFIKQCNSKFSSVIGNVDSDKSLKKTKSFKLIKALKEDWVESAKK